MFPFFIIVFIVHTMRVAIDSGKSTLLFLLIVSSLLIRCTAAGDKQTLFHQLSSDKTGVTFNNALNYTRELNPYTYRNFYNGGGVGIGDFNNDGLQDIFFTGNQVSNRLYINNGDFKFEDITESAGLTSAGVWSTGASVADINGDGWLDIYICKSGKPGGPQRHNELFINNGDLTFTEKAKDYGIDIVGLSTDATFFDYDRDGDLDMYLLNNSFESVTGIDVGPGLRKTSDPKGGDKLFRNETVRSGQEDSTDHSFTDVTEKAGIFSSKIGFGLDVMVGDINEDNWPDIYITNDFFERDYLYLNKGDGSFSEVLPHMMQSISLSSMGGDMGDINHDGRPDIYVTDMLPASLERAKSKTAFDFWEDYSKRVDNGYHHQFVRNTLQLNNGFIPNQESDPVRHVSFSEIGRLAGVEATDWSWTVLFADFNQDGSNDIFVTNGIFKDLTDQDYISDNNTLRKVRSIITENKPVNILFDDIPSVPIPNFAFAGTDSLVFSNQTEKWGLDEPGFSNGAAYVDLDNDGDLDLVINNVNEQASIYENKSEQVFPDQKSLTLMLQGSARNTFAVGAKVEVWVDGKLHYREQVPNRGFQSSVDPRIHIGLGNASEIDSLKIRWPDGRTSVKRKVKSGEFLTFKQAKANTRMDRNTNEKDRPERILREVTDQINLSYRHRESDFNPFERSPLLYEDYSRAGPASCVADINNDGLDDIYLGGAKGQTGGIFVQNEDQSFTEMATDVFLENQASEDIDCIWFDANGDEALDLYVASGGSEFPSSSSALSDRLYMNSKNGFSKSSGALPSSRFEVTATVNAADYDRDGDMDLFTGSRAEPFAYGIPVGGHILRNDGTGKFEDVTEEVGPDLQNLGMLTDAQWFDFDRDGDMDIAVVGEWMPVTVFRNRINEKGKATFVNITQELNLANTNGLWKSILLTDLDGDGHSEIVAGNIGLNSQFATDLKLWINDFDQNGSIEQILTTGKGENDIPLVLRQDLLKQMSGFRNRAPDFKTYADMSMSDLFTVNELENSVVLSSYELRSAVFWNENGERFKMEPLPVKAQLAPVFAVNNWKSGSSEERFIILGGNLSTVKPQFGSYRSSYGIMIKTGLERNLKTLEYSDSGLFAKGEIRGIYRLKSREDSLLLIVRNNDKPLWFK